MITLVLGGILVATLTSYLWLVRAQNLLVAESQAWNSALAATEAGIEEGLAQINVSFGTNYLASVQANWPNASAGVYGPRISALTNSSYSVTLLSAAPGPTLIATGMVCSPLLSRPVARAVQVTTAPAPVFAFALGAQQTISFGRHSVLIDSYDSSDPDHSTGGRYNPLTRKAGGNVATSAGISDARNPTGINGKLWTGSQGNHNLGANGLVGDLSFTGPGIEPGWFANDLNLEFKNVQTPDTSRFVPPTSDATNKYALGNGGYIIQNDLSLRPGETLLVNGNATLFVGGNVQMAGPGYGENGISAINIAPNCSLRIFVAGPVANFTQVNTTGPAGSFQYFGLPSNTSVSWNGNSSYVGALYAPQAKVVLGSSSRGSQRGGYDDYQGACLANSIILNARFHFHYDEALKRTGPAAGFVVTSWREL